MSPLGEDDSRHLRHVLLLVSLTADGMIRSSDSEVVREISLTVVLIRDFPVHATFREKGAKLACADNLGVFLSVTLCNKANFDPLQHVKYDGLEKM